VTRAGRAWDRFFFQPDTARVLGLYRIVLGLIVLYSFALLAKDATMFFSDAGLLTSTGSAQVFGPNYLTLFDWIRGPGGVRAALAALFVSAVFFTVGFHTRGSAVALYLLVVSFHVRNVYVLQGADAVIRTMLFFFMFAPAGAAFSVDRLRRRLRTPGGVLPEARVSPWAQRMMQIQVAIIYFMTAYAKLMGERYRDGSAMYYMLGRLDIHLSGLEQLMNYPVIYTSMTVAAVVMEIPMPFLLWFRATRPYASLLGVALHAWIQVFMVIPVFGIVMMTSYLAFYDEADFDRVLARMRRRVASRRARLVLDTASPSGARWNRWIPILDVLGRVAIEPSAGGGEPRPDQPAVRLVTPEGKARDGLSALGWLCPRLLGVVWVIPFLYLPGRSPGVEGASAPAGGK
jgi:hypothetical protein